MLSMNIRRFEALEYHGNEAINTLCMNLFFAGEYIKKIMVTSAHPQEGKSFITINLLRSLASLGMKVVLVDADIRASALQGTYDIQINTPEGQKYLGLTGYLAGHCGVDDILAETDIPNAYMILSGHNVINSLPLLNSPALPELLNRLANEFDVVLVDAPPVLSVIDAAKIAKSCDGILFVIKSGETSHTEVRSAINQLEKTGVSILGTVLNQYDARKYGDRYYYSDSYYYGADKRDGKGSGRAKHMRFIKRIKRYFER